MRTPIAPATKLKRGTEHFLNGKPVYVERDAGDGTIFISDSKERNPGDNFWWINKSELKPSIKLVSPINKFSDTRAKENKIYLTLHKVFLENHVYCEANVKGCTRIATEVHHSQGRIGSRLISVETFVALCDNCHRWAENNPVQAKEMGLSLNRL